MRECWAVSCLSLIKGINLKSTALKKAILCSKQTFLNLLHSVHPIIHMALEHRITVNHMGQIYFPKKSCLCSQNIGY